MASKLAILNAMASPDFDRALDLHRQWGLVWIDLKDSIYGHTVETLDEGTALRAKDAIDAAGLKVYCLSTSLMHDDLAKGEEYFRSQHIDRIAGLATTVSILRPKYIRLLAGREPRGRRQRDPEVQTVGIERDRRVAEGAEEQSPGIDLQVPQSGLLHARFERQQSELLEEEVLQSRHLCRGLGEGHRRASGERGHAVLQLDPERRVRRRQQRAGAQRLPADSRQ